MTIRQFCLLSLVALLLPGVGCRSADAQELFGRSESTGEAALTGIFYDLKQTQQRKPTGVTPNDYSKIVDAFINSGWDEAVFAPYFRSVRSLYTTQIFIPMMSAGEAPKAFDLQAIVKPSEWVAHYKGQVSPPEDGTYRFCGYADDILAVAVDEKTVLIGARFPISGWTPELSHITAGNSYLTYGTWIELRKNQIVDLDVIIGERPGGTFGGFLLYQKQGVDYPLDAQKQPILSIFQLARHEMPTYPPHLAPAFSVPAVPWKGHQ